MGFLVKFSSFHDAFDVIGFILTFDIRFINIKKIMEYSVINPSFSKLTIADYHLIPRIFFSIMIGIGSNEIRIIRSLSNSFTFNFSRLSLDPLDAMFFSIMIGLVLPRFKA